eukprot:SAG22_NODE_1901_length_3339_cov_3.176543_2_plen_988_part_00
MAAHKVCIGSATLVRGHGARHRAGKQIIGPSQAAGRLGLRSTFLVSITFCGPPRPDDYSLQLRCGTLRLRRAKDNTIAGVGREPIARLSRGARAGRACFRRRRRWKPVVVGVRGVVWLGAPARDTRPSSSIIGSSCSCLHAAMHGPARPRADPGYTKFSTWYAVALGPEAAAAAAVAPPGAVADGETGPAAGAKGDAPAAASPSPQAKAMVLDVPKSDVTPTRRRAPKRQLTQLGDGNANGSSDRGADDHGPSSSSGQPAEQETGGAAQAEKQAHASHQAPPVQQPRRRAPRKRALPPAGAAVRVSFDDGLHHGTVARCEGEHVFINYERGLDDFRERWETPTVKGNLQVLMTVKSQRRDVSAAQLRRLARTGGLCADEVVSALCVGLEAANLVLPAEPIDWSAARRRRQCFIVVSADSDTSDGSDEDFTASGNARRPAKGVPVDADDEVLQHMMMLGPHARSAPESGPYCLFENAKSLAAHDNGRAAVDIAERSVPTQLGMELVSFDSGRAGISQATRLRLYWTNIPLPEKEGVSGVQIVKHCSLLENKPAFDRRQRLNCLITKQGTEIMNKLNDKLERQHSHNLARGVSSEAPEISRQEWQKIQQNNLLFRQAVQGGMWQLRMLSQQERCGIMGFPQSWTSCVTPTVAAKMLGQSFHVPTIELLLSGLDSKLRAAITTAANPLGTTQRPLVVPSFFDGIGAAWVALKSCLERWGLVEICVHYVAIEKDKDCRRVLFTNFPQPVKIEPGAARDAQTRHHRSYHLHSFYAESKATAAWGDIERAEKAIVADGRHRTVYTRTGASARLDEAFLVFNGFPCIIVAGLNRAHGVNGRQASMAEGAAGPQTGLFYSSERILGKIVDWKKEVEAARSAVRVQNRMPSLTQARRAATTKVLRSRRVLSPRGHCKWRCAPGLVAICFVIRDLKLTFACPSVHPRHGRPQTNRTNNSYTILVAKFRLRVLGEQCCFIVVHVSLATCKVVASPAPQ